MGTKRDLDEFLFWAGSYHSNGPLSVSDFDLSADSDNDPLNGGMSLPGSTPLETVYVHGLQRFSFTSTSTQYIHMYIKDDHGDNSSWAGFSEEAFAGSLSTVPEPASLVIFGTICLFAGGRRRKS